MTYTSHDFLDDNHDSDMYPEDFLNSLHPSGLPGHKLNLKVGAVVLLIRNLNPAKHLMNGTRLIIMELHDFYIVAKIQPPKAASGQVRTMAPEDAYHIIPRICCTPSEDNLSLHFIRLQIPVIPAFAMTVNKSQGQTFQRVGLYLKEGPCFSHGQVYVALSRVGDPAAIRVLPQDGGKREGKEGMYLHNVVYKTVFEGRS